MWWAQHQLPYSNSLYRLLLPLVSKKQLSISGRDYFWIPSSVLLICMAFLMLVLYRISHCSFVMSFEMGKVPQHFRLSGLHWLFRLLVFYVHPGVGLSNSIL